MAEKRRYIVDLEDFNLVLPRVQATGVSILSIQPVVESCTVECDAAMVETLRRIDGVRGVFPDFEAELLLTQAVAEAENDYWALANICNRVGEYRSICTGYGVDICIIDTGFNPMHADFGRNSECNTEPIQHDISELQLSNKPLFGNFYPYQLPNSGNSYKTNGWPHCVTAYTYNYQFPIVGIDEYTWLSNPDARNNVEFIVHLEQTQDVSERLDAFFLALQTQPELKNMFIRGVTGFTITNIVGDIVAPSGSVVERVSTCSVKYRVDYAKKSDLLPYQSGGVMVARTSVTDTMADSFGGRAMVIRPAFFSSNGIVVTNNYYASYWSANEYFSRYRHGQCVAGCAAGTMSGIAKGAHLYLLPTRASTSSVAVAIEDVIQFHQFKLAHQINRPTVANMSWTITMEKRLLTPQEQEEITRYYSYIAELMDDSGVVWVAAAGNSKMRLPAEQYLMFPQQIRPSTSLNAGAIDIQNRLAYFSNYGAIVDVFAPGHRVKTAKTYGMQLNTAIYLLSPSEEEENYMSISGTSVSSPYTVGVVACALQAGRFGIFASKSQTHQFRQWFLTHYTRAWNNVKHFNSAISLSEVRSNPSLLDNPNNWFDGFPPDDNGSPAKLLYLPNAVFVRGNHWEIPAVSHSYEMNINGEPATVYDNYVSVNGVLYGYGQTFKLGNVVCKVKN